ncbi:hypothetical protein G6L95_06625 [Agrobacterium rhizogenes]|nr:hypothetical protein [Rhizobium rhizogenes]NTI54625.1 hypothetical protein [Rhizobium rhizogenes]
MPFKIDQLVEEIEPSRTVLFFGSGSSIPSGAPSVGQLIDSYAKAFTLPAEGYSLSEITLLAERKSGSRKKVIGLLRQQCQNLKPTGGLRNVSLYDWKSIYTTNYDTLVEQAYKQQSKDVKVYASDFDFTVDEDRADQVLFKLHGTIEKDECDGYNGRIILTQNDYEQTHKYREQLFKRLEGDLVGANLVIIGHSLGDSHIRELVTKSAALKSQAGGNGRVWLLIFTPDENRALIYEDMGLTVCFGGIDEFFAGLIRKRSSDIAATKDSSDPLDQEPGLIPVTIDVQHAANHIEPNFSSMFNGWPATYADVSAGYTFKRSIGDRIIPYLNSDGSLCATLLGASGVGKSTAAKQILLKLASEGWSCWEHQAHHALDARKWISVARYLQHEERVGVLLIDEAHQHLAAVNELIDELAVANNGHLKLFFISTKNQWYPRVKSGNFFKHGKSFELRLLSDQEIDALLNLIENVPEVKRLAEESFVGFDRSERRRRLVVRSQKDMFVCLKNIFNSAAFDEIILREYASLPENFADIFKYVAALETAGVQVHRQLIIRLLGIPSQQIAAALSGLADIVTEYDHDVKHGIYGWRCRHKVISAIITKYKFQDLGKLIKLFEDVIDATYPTYEIEIRSLKELCNADSGIPRIGDKKTQNRLLAKMISRVPGERVPRHRLIRNLIEMREFDKADTEIKVFDKDFGFEGPVHRYKIKLLTERAIHTPGILEEDRIVMLEQAHDLALVGMRRFSSNKNVLAACVELGLEYYRRTANLEFYDEAMDALRAAEEKLGDPQINVMITRFLSRVKGNSSDLGTEAVDELLPEPDEL